MTPAATHANEQTRVSTSPFFMRHAGCGSRIVSTLWWAKLNRQRLGGRSRARRQHAQRSIFDMKLSGHIEARTLLEPATRARFLVDRLISRQSAFDTQPMATSLSRRATSSRRSGRSTLTLSRSAERTWCGLVTLRDLRLRLLQLFNTNQKPAEKVVPKRSHFVS
jgi:hypothetical protein